MRARWWVVLPALVAFGVGVLGIGVRSTYGGNASVDEPQYLLTALSLWEDRDLDIADELAAQRWRAFHAAELPVQTEVLPDGRQVSPHDPLLPVLLAAPTGLFGWVGAKVAMALLAAGCAGLTSWVAVRRFGLPPWVAAAGVAAANGSPPLGVYAQQVYPEVPAALAVLGAVAAVSAPVLRRRHVAAALVGVVALPWLGAKYALVALAVAAATAAVARGRVPARVLGWAGVALAGSGVLWLAGHRLLYGGWTAYATGDQFQATGELSVMGVDPDFVGRSLRLVGLLADDHYGLVAWQPAYVLLPAAVAVALWRGDRRHRWLLVAPLLAGWATAVWVALTMHGFWWPGRQVVVVLPLGVLALLVALRSVGRRWAWVLAAALASLGPLTMAALLAAGWQGRLTWVFAFDRVPSPAYQALRLLLPDYRGAAFWPGHLVWAVVLLASAGLAVRLTRPAAPPPHVAAVPLTKGTLV